MIYKVEGLQVISALVVTSSNLKVLVDMISSNLVSGYFVIKQNIYQKNLLLHKVISDSEFLKQNIFITYFYSTVCPPVCLTLL